MTTRNLDALFDPQASLTYDPAQQSIPIGERAHGAGADSTRVPTLAILRGPCEKWVAALERLGDAGVRAVVLDAGPDALDTWSDANPAAASGADADAGPADRGGPSVAGCLQSAGRPYLMRLLGPGDCGIVDPRRKLAMGPAFAIEPDGHEPLPEGPCAWVAQSGDAARAALAFARAHGLGVAHMVALGDAIDVDAADAVDYLAGDPHTKAVLLVLNRVRSARKFMSAVRACVRNKPVLVWCEPAAGEDPLAYDAALERAGVVRLPDLSALLDAWAVLQSPQVGASALLARYRAERERLMQTPPALPPHRLEYAHAQAWLRSLPTAEGPICLTQQQVRRLLDDFDIAVGADASIGQASDDGRVDLAHDVPFGSPTAAQAESRLGIADLQLAMRDAPAFGPYLTLRAAAGLPQGQSGQGPGPAEGALLPLDAALARAFLDRVAPPARIAPGTIEDAAQDVPMVVASEQCHRSAVALLVHLSELLCSVRQVLEFDATLSYDGTRAYLTQASVLAGKLGARRPLAIRPYPLELEERLAWDGIALTIRPIRPEDEAAHAAFFRAMSAEDLRLRFFGVTRQPDHSQLARYVQIDYDREMALIACSADDSGEGGKTPSIHGVVRAVSDPDNETAEFAVTIRSGEQGHHLGRLLMDRIIAYCRRRGTHMMVGEILHENTRMLALARDCGFTLGRSEDPGVVSVRLQLNPSAAQTDAA